jgi:hypothetical protein
MQRMAEPWEPDVERVGRALGEEPAAWHEAPGHGAPSNRRWIVRLPSDRLAEHLVFVKIAAFDYTADWLRAEHATYEALDGLAFLPRLLGWDDDGVHPVLAIESFADATWPPPWNPEGIDAVRAALEQVHAQTPPDHIHAMDHRREQLASWSSVAADPEPVLRLGLCSAAWLEGALPALLAAEAQAPLDGESLLHMDVRSDNLCLDIDRAVLVDWNHAARGNPQVDLAAWLPSLEAEGGPRPDDVFPDCPAGLAVILAGYFISRAPLDPIPQAPHARGLQLAQSQTALPWASRLLDLPPPS